MYTWRVGHGYVANFVLSAHHITYVRICEEGLLGVRRSRLRVKEPCSASLLSGNGGNFSRFILHDFLSTSGGNRRSKCFFFFRKLSKCFSTFLRVNWSPKRNKFLNKSLRTSDDMFFEVEEGRSYGCLWLCQMRMLVLQ